MLIGGIGATWKFYSSPSLSQLSKPLFVVDIND